MWSAALVPVRDLGPFIIYEGVVRECLGTLRGHYPAYVAAWEPGHKTHAVPPGRSRLRSKQALRYTPLRVVVEPAPSNPACSGLRFARH